MSFLRRPGVKGWLLSAMAGAASLMACSPPPIQQEKSDGLESLAEREGLVFDLKLDTLAYMSCQPNNSGDSNAYFTFQVGAYRTGGAALSADFVSRMNAMNRMGGDIAEVIQRSPVLQGARPVLSIRRVRSLQAAVQNSVSPFFVNLDSTSLLSRTIPNPGQYVRAIPTEDAGPHRFEGKIYLPSTNQDDLRSNFAGDDNYILAVTLGSEGESNYGYARAPKEQDGSKRVYGTRFDLKFAAAGPNDGGFVTDRYLTEAAEFDLETGRQKRNRSWSCPELYRFTIHQEHGPNCPKTVDPMAYNSLQAAVRQVLKAEDWSINWDVKYRCAVVKSSTAAKCSHSQEKYLHNVSFCFLQ